MIDTYPYEKTRDRFRADTAEHELTIIRDDGFYRHLRFMKPGTYSYGYDLVTWPGFLTMTGDMGEFVFSRTTDMFKFFEGSRGDGINADYWAEKMRASGDPARAYSDDVLAQYVKGWVDYRVEQYELSAEDEKALRDALRWDVLHRDGHDETSAHMALRDFEHEGMRIEDAWEWDLKDYTYRFLWACWAIREGIARYREATS